MTRYSEQPRNMRSRIDAMQARPTLSPAELPGAAGRPRGSRQHGQRRPGHSRACDDGHGVYWADDGTAKRRRKKKPKA